MMTARLILALACAWPILARVSVAHAGDAEETRPPMVGVLSISPAEPPRPTVTVHIEAGQEVALEALGAESAVICHAPCDAPVPLDGVYRVSGGGMVPSHGFRLSALPGEHVVLSVDPASSVKHETARRTMIGGGVVAAAGLAVLAYMGVAVIVCVDSAGGGCPLPQTNTGLAAMGIGGLAALGGGGIVALTGFILSRSTSGVEQLPGAENHPQARREDRWLRLPAWREQPQSADTFPRATAIPIFSTSF